MKEEKPPVISEKTLLPISFVILLLGGAWRVESTSFRAEATEKQVDKLQDEFHHVNSKLIQVTEALARIEGYLKIQQEQKVKQSNDP